ncbi:hypothetical protein [Saccharothrix sp. NRRL B-16314]|uniref:hypothetical protein n=1 Tax=Saccharothrix sp. NRRL B-16314 TaxID=1463825 RepID=UPI00052467C5|nr:hypothetical protein [Saccharothrix sp. NRRL B-16314]
MSRRLFGAVLLLVAGVAAVVGTFLPLYWQGAPVGTMEPRGVVSSWKVEFQNVRSEFVDVTPWKVPQFGVPIVLAAVLLVVAAVLVLLPEHQRLAARYTAVGATGVLAGSVAATGAFVVSVVGNTPPADDSGARSGGAGEGVLVLVAAALVALVGVVLIHGRRAESRPGGPVVYRVDDGGDEDLDTPPYGIPVVEFEPIHDTGHERPADGPDHTR